MCSFFELALCALCPLAQNKDDLTIPLNLEQLPTARAFRDAIESLSPEQQRFAKAIRSMQLEGSMFGVCVIQLKPQLEKLLKLPDDSLTKEIRLTQDLLELFIKYQIPSDQLSFAGDHVNASKQTKLDFVAAQVRKMYAMIDALKQAELDQRAEEARMAELARIAEAKRLADLEAQEQRERYREEELDLCVNKSMMLESASMDFSPMPSKSKGGGGGMMKAARNFFSSGPKPSAAVSAAPSSRAMMADSAPMMVQKQSAPMRRSAAVSRPVVQALPSSSTSVAAPSPAPAPVAAATAVVAPKQPADPSVPAEVDPSQIQLEPVEDAAQPLDWTTLPVLLDRQLEALDDDAALRSVIITAGGVWAKKSQKSLLSPPTTTSMGESEQTLARKEAFDLLDALSRSGSLPIDCATLHIIIASSHGFDRTLIDTVIQDNVNPIEKVERSSMIVAAMVQDEPVERIIKPDQRERVMMYNPKLLMGATEVSQANQIEAGGELSSIESQ